MDVLDIAKRAILEKSLSVDVFFKDMTDVEEVRFSDFPNGIVQGSKFGDNCFISLGEGARNALKKGSGILAIQSMRPQAEIDGCRIFVDDFQGRISVLIGSEGTVALGKLGVVRLDIRLGHKGVVVVGDGTTINGAKLVAVNCSILCGQDGLWSDDILIQGFDQHGIVDLETREIINAERKDVVIGRHVWLGRRSTIMPATRIGDGSIVGASSVVTKEVPSCSVVAGSPGRIVQENVSWSRPWTHLDAESARFIDDAIQERGL